MSTLLSIQTEVSNPKNVFVKLQKEYYTLIGLLVTHKKLMVHDSSSPTLFF